MWQSSNEKKNNNLKNTRILNVNLFSCLAILFWTLIFILLANLVYDAVYYPERHPFGSEAYGWIYRSQTHYIATLSIEIFIMIVLFLISLKQNNVKRKNLLLLLGPILIIAISNTMSSFL